MCGIFGIYSENYTQDNVDTLFNCLKLLQHRGKDGRSMIKRTVSQQVHDVLHYGCRMFSTFVSLDIVIYLDSYRGENGQCDTREPDDTPLFLQI